MNARRSYLLPGIVLLVTVGTIVTGVLVPRDMSLGEGTAEVVGDADLLAFSISRLVTAVLLVSSAVGIAFALYRGGLIRPGFSVWVSYLAYALLNYVLPGIAGKVPNLEVRFLYGVVLITAVYVSRPMAAAHLATLAKVALGAFIYASLAASVLIPHHAVAAEYGGLIPGLGVRLYGVGGGAVSLGAMSAAYLAVEAVWPTRSWTRILHVLAAAGTLVLTQAKTSWLFVLVGATYWAYRKIERRLSVDAMPAARRALTKTALLSFGVFLACIGIAFAIHFYRGADLAGVQGAENLETLTGRTYIWNESIRVWLDDPILGYGTGLWRDEQFRNQHGSFAHAHNQFIHALGSAGVVGLAGLLAYVIAASVAAARALRVNALPLVMLALLLNQSLTEVPLLNLWVLDGFFVLHLLLFASLMSAANLDEVRGRAPPGVVGSPGAFDATARA